MGRIDDAFEHDLDLAAGFLATEKTGLDDPGVVEDQQVAGLEQARQIGKLRSTMLATADMQQPAAGALG
jgi:hypothetical protein